MSLTIGFNGRFLLRPYTGIGQYSLNLLTQMASQAPDTKWLVVVPEKLPKDHPLNSFTNITIQLIKEKELPSASVRQVWWEQVQCPRALRKKGVDIIHCPYPSNPRFTGPWVLRRPKTIVTVHDTIPWKRPEYQKKWRSRLYQGNARKAIKKADHVIAVSQTTALEFTDQVQFPFHHVSVIHEAASPVFKAAGPLPTSKRPYLIYVGGYDPRKNVTRLIEAYQEYIAPLYEVDLILVGAETAIKAIEEGSNRLLEPLPKRIIDDLKGTVVYEKSLSPEKLATLYRGAMGFINVSLAEGFNLPLLEAAASHLPILTSDLPIHREIIGSSGRFCDPKSTKSIGEMILNFLRDSDLREELKQKSIQLATQYTWQKAAETTLSLYRKLV